MEKLVSVVIPAYNHESFIKDCVESVINQTYKNLEIIIQDDCSTDNTVKELKKIKDHRIKLILSKKNNGIVDTLNNLIKLCQGDYIAVLGSDDVWYPEKLEKQIKILEGNSKIGCVFTDVDVIDENNVLYATDDPEFPSSIFKTDNMNMGKRIRSLYDIGNHLCHSSSLMPREVVEKIGLYNKAYRQLHDYDYWIRVASKFEIYIINEKLMAYRRIRNNTSSISCNSKKNLTRTINELYYIKSNMITKMEDELFKEAFKSNFRNKSSKTKEEIICEKFFLLSELGYGNYLNNQYAISLIFNYNDKEKLFKIFEKKFNYTLNDFYNETSLASELYPIECTNKYNKVVENYKNANDSLRQELDIVVSSRSWKITRPLRVMSGLLKRVVSNKKL